MVLTGAVVAVCVVVLLVVVVVVAGQRGSLEPGTHMGGEVGHLGSDDSGVQINGGCVVVALVVGQRGSFDPGMHFAGG